MQSEQENNKRIAKNTVYLYLRMVVMILVSLYTSRIVLEALGVSDYGIYNVMGGIIGMLGYVNSLLAGGISRFLTIGLGEGNENKLRNIFSTILSITLISSTLVLVLGETIGLWFVNNEMNIPAGRMQAANWVYQCALISSCLTIIQSPYTASVISHEKMKMYAYMSLFDATIKLLIVYLLVMFSYDKLILYAILLLLANILNIVIFRIYCIRQFHECRTMKLSLNKSLLTEMLSYNSWNMVGGLAGVLANHGINIIVNVFFGTVVNAARGIANQVQSLFNTLYSNFQMAANPQLIKYYAQKDMHGMHNLAINTSRYCGFLLLCAVVPAAVNVDGLLAIWLKEVPPYTADFSICCMIYSLSMAIDAPLGNSIHAVGKMKWPNLSTALVNMCVFPMTYIAFSFGGHPAWGYILHICSVLICTGIDLFMVKRFINFPVMRFIRSAIFPVWGMLLLTLVVSVTVRYYIGNDSPLATIGCCSISLVTTLVVIFFIGLPGYMRVKLMEKIKIYFGYGCIDNYS